MSVKIIYFVHGTTKDNEQKLASGWNHGELSQKGIERSIALREKVNYDDIDIVISSDLQRAIDSANYVYKGKKEILHDQRIRECNYGDLNQKPSDLVRYEEHITELFPNGECLKDVEKRVRDFCKYLLEKFDGKTVALVSHKAPQLALEVITMNKKWEQAIKEDWRLKKAWQPGWRYEIKEEEING